MKDIENIKTVLRYDQKTGLMYWLSNRGRGVKAGDVAGHTRKKCGYVRLTVFGKNISGHHMAWAFVHGYWPVRIDHKDRNRSNNAINNLREATQSQNCLNIGLRASNTSGYRGVTWNKSCKKWQVESVLRGKTHYLGVFKTAEKASEVYEAFCLENHGEFNSSPRRFSL